MKMPKLSTFTTLTTTLLFLTACDSAGNFSATDQVDLDINSMTLNEVIDLAQDQNLNVQQLTHEYEVAGEPMVGFLPINKPGDLESAEERWPELYKGMLLDFVDSDQKAGLKDASTLKLKAAINEKVPEFKVTGITAEVDKSGIPYLKRYPKVRSLIARGAFEVQADPQKSEPNPSDLQALGLKRWVPTAGTVYTGKSEVGTNLRYVRQYMEWSRRDMDFPTNRGYEHDFFLNDYGGTSRPGIYFAGLVGYKGIPIVDYASTSWPSSGNPYLDTRLADPLGEKAYTIGIVYAERLESYKRYTTYIRVKQGNTNFDNAKLTASLQIPARTHSPSRPCGNQWCMFTADLQRLVPAWGISVPGTHHWRY